MLTKRIDHTLLLQLDKGEEILSCIKQACDMHQIHLGTVSGIGAVDHAVLGLYLVCEKRYYSHEHNKALEIVSLLGNITEQDGKPYLHLHAGLADQDGNLIGGHLNEAIVSATAEIFITILDGHVNRYLDTQIGLNRMSFSD